MLQVNAIYHKLGKGLFNPVTNGLFAMELVGQQDQGHEAYTVVSS